MDTSMPSLHDYGPDDDDQLLPLLERGLAAYGLAPDISTTDSDLLDVAASYLAGGGAFRVLKHQGKIIGMFGLHNEGGAVVELRKMYLDPAFKGQGLGRLLMQDALSLARKAGYRQMVLETNSRLLEAIHMYRKVGFREVPRKQCASRCDMAMAMDL
jgi:putative acetyltransferase